MSKSQPKSTPTPKPTTKPTAAKINAALKKAEHDALTEAVRGPKKPALTPEQIRIGRSGGFC